MPPSPDAHAPAAAAATPAAAPREDGRRVSCGACGKPNRAAARFCRSCGKALGAGAAGAPSAAAAVPIPLRPATAHAVPGTDAPPSDTPRQARSHRGVADRPATPRRPVSLALVLVVVMGAGALWWQRAGTPPSPPVEEILTEPRPVAPGSLDTALPAPASSGVPPSPGTTPAPPLAPPPTAMPVPAAVGEADAPSAVPAGAVPTGAAGADSAPVGGTDAAPAAVPTAPAAAQPPTPSASAVRPAAPRPQPSARTASGAATASRNGPEAACADSSQFTRPMCLSIQCFKSEFRRHPTCVRLDNETRERRQREIDQGMVGG